MITLLDERDLGQLRGITDKDIVATVLQNNWCPSSYKDPKGRRVRDNWLDTDLLVFDIDDGMSLEEAKDLVQEEGWDVIIGTSKSHQIEKKGQPPCDRFRIILALSERIKDESEYKSTWQYYADTYFPTADKACKDVTRFYYPCKEIVLDINNEKFLDPMPDYRAEVTPEFNDLECGQLLRLWDPATGSSVAHESISKLWDSTWRFVNFGAPQGSFHINFVKASQNMRDANYPFDQAHELLNQAAEKSDGALLEDKYVRQLEEFYRKPPNPSYKTKEIRADDVETDDDLGNWKNKTEYLGNWKNKTEYLGNWSLPKDIIGEMVTYLNDKDTVQGEPTCFKKMNSLLGGGLRKGELSVLVAEAKTGKSTLFDQLIVDYVERGIPVAYASREMRPAEEVLPHMLNIVLKRNLLKEHIDEQLRIKINEKVSSWPLYFAKGYGSFPKEAFECWVKELHDKGVEYFYVDHFHYCLEDPMNNSELALFIQAIKRLVNELNIHIFLIVQPNSQSDQNGKSLLREKGGKVIEQTLDNKWEFSRLQGDNNTNITKLQLTRARKLIARTGHLFLKYDPDSTILEETVRSYEEPDPSPMNNPNKYSYKFPRIN